MSALTESESDYDPRDHSSELRATDVQREYVMSVVHGALVDGRLQVAEFGDRVAAICTAKTQGDLGSAIDDLVEYRSAYQRARDPSDKKILPALLLCLVLGIFGAHRFYLGCRTLGIVTLLMTFSVIGAVVTIPWAFMDVLGLPMGVVKDGKGRCVEDWA